MIDQILDYYPILEFVAGCVTALVFLFPVAHREAVTVRYLSIIPIYLAAGVLNYHLGDDFIMSRILIYPATLIAVIICAEINWKEVLYHVIWIIMVSQLFMMLYALLAIALDPVFNFSDWLELFLILFYIAGYNTVMGLTVAKGLLLNHSYHIGPRQFFSSLLLFVIFEILTYLLSESMLANTNFTLSVLAVMGQFYCATVLYLQNALFSRVEVQQELEKIYYLWDYQKNQYQISKENINLINQKCHDLRHQVSALRGKGASGDSDSYLKEIENSINIYDSIVRTGNEALDTILTEKSLYCQSRTIGIHCVADGEAMSFISPVDIYTIFGNALDNAIESVERLSNNDSRFIDVMIYSKKSMLVINIVNPLYSNLELEGGLPKTTKSDTGYHGFGLKSIRHTAESYEGFVSIDTQDDMFSLSLVIPLPEAENPTKSS